MTARFAFAGAIRTSASTLVAIGRAWTAITVRFQTAAVDLLPLKGVRRPGLMTSTNRHRKATLFSNLEPGTALLAVLIAVIVVCAAAYAFQNIVLRETWPPLDWPYSVQLSFIVPEGLRYAGAAKIVALLLLVWSCAYAVALKCLWHRPATRSASFGIIAIQVLLIALTLTVRMPVNSDQFAYVSYGELVSDGYNPYNPPKKDSVGQTSLRDIATVWSVAEGSPDAAQRVVVRDRYGPLFTLAAAAILAPFRNTSVEMQAWIMRLLAGLAAIGCTLVLWQFMRERRNGLALLAAFALCPAVIIQTGEGGHNDIYSLLFAISAVLLLQKNKPIVASVLFGASIAIKLTYIPFTIAFVAYVFFRRGARMAALSLAAVAAVLLVLAFPFGFERAIIQPVLDIHNYNASTLGSLLVSAARRVPAASWVSQAMYSDAYIAVLIACGCLIALRPFRKETTVLIALELLMIFAAGHLEPWYALILVPLLLLDEPWALPLFVGVTLASQVFHVNAFVATYNYTPIVPFVGLALLLTPLAAVLYGVKPRVRGHKHAPI